MLLLAPPRFELLLGAAKASSKHAASTLTAQRQRIPARENRSFTLSSSLVSAPRLVLLNSLPPPTGKHTATTPPTRSTSPLAKRMASEHEYISPSPRSPRFSPTLNSIPEVVESEALDALPEPAHTTVALHKTSTVSHFIKTSNPTLQDTAAEKDILIPEPTSTIPPRLSHARVKHGILIPPLSISTSISASARSRLTSRTLSSASRILRQVLDADRVRRRRAMRVWMKAVVFLKMLWLAQERYGSVVVASAVYVPR